MICEEYPSHPGGVACFSDVLAKEYFGNGQLKGVISLSPFPSEKRDFPIVHLRLPQRKYGSMPMDHIVLFRKINSLLFHAYSLMYHAVKQPVRAALSTLGYHPSTDVLFFTYQVHFPWLFARLFRRYKGEQWILYHGLDLMGFASHPQEIHESLDVAQKVIFNSKATEKLFYRLGFAAGNTEVRYPFLDTHYLKDLDLYSMEEIESRIGIRLKGYFLVTSICRLVKRKGIHLAIDIVKELVILFPGKIQYVIAGSGPEEEILKKRVAEYGLQETIHFLGYIDDRLKYSLMNASNVFLMPNYDDGGKDFEGFGISFLEADYYGNYVVGGKHGGAGEAIEHVSRGLSIDHSSEGKNEAIEKISALIRHE